MSRKLCKSTRAGSQPLNIDQCWAAGTTTLAQRTLNMQKGRGRGSAEGGKTGRLENDITYNNRQRLCAIVLESLSE
eukprot:5511687-Pyramimonas_sp.AAC.1